MHVKTKFRINLRRFCQAVILNQAFLHSDALTFNSACVHLLVLTHIYKGLVNAVFVDLALKQLQYIKNLRHDQKHLSFNLNMQLLLQKFEREGIYFKLEVLLEHCRRSVLENTESQLPSGDNQRLPEGSRP